MRSPCRVREMPEHDLPVVMRVVLTPFAIVGDAVIVVTAPVWFPIAYVVAIQGLVGTH